MVGALQGEGCAVVESGGREIFDPKYKCLCNISYLHLKLFLIQQIALEPKSCNWYNPLKVADNKVKFVCWLWHLVDSPYSSDISILIRSAFSFAWQTGNQTIVQLDKSAIVQSDAITLNQLGRMVESIELPNSKAGGHCPNINVWGHWPTVENTNLHNYDNKDEYTNTRALTNSQIRWQQTSLHSN